LSVFFVCGAPKSGTTWLQRILDAHPEVTCSGEGHFIDRLAAPMAQVMSAYNTHLEGIARHVYEDRPYYDLVAQADYETTVRGFILERLRARATEETRWIGDKTPGYTHHLPQLRQLFPEAKFFHIVRDPRDVAVSRMAHTYRLGVVEALAPGAASYRKSLETAVRLWREAITAVDAFATDHPGLICEVRYGDLHDDPIGQAERLFNFLGAPTPRILMERIAAETSFQTMAGRPPGEEDLTSFLRKGVPGDWRVRLDPASADYVVETCGDLMKSRRFAA
jgi:hypothetical protein